MRLVIAEKPSVAQSIAAVLGAKSRHDGYLEGSGYIVSWCFGHLAELADAAVYNADDAKWTLAALPIIPTSSQMPVIPPSPGCRRMEYRSGENNRSRSFSS